MKDLHSFLYPITSYQGNFKPENLVFNANLQEFSQRISYICCLENSGKINANESFQQIRSLWYQLEQSHEQLNISN